VFLFRCEFVPGKTIGRAHRVSKWLNLIICCLYLTDGHVYVINYLAHIVRACEWNILLIILIYLSNFKPKYQLAGKIYFKFESLFTLIKKRTEKMTCFTSTLCMFFAKRWHEVRPLLCLNCSALFYVVPTCQRDKRRSISWERVFFISRHITYWLGYFLLFYQRKMALKLTSMF
jgi:hypothetical protein